MIFNEVMSDCYFNNKPEIIYQNLLEKLKNKEAVDNLLACLTIELKPRKESILGTMEFMTMSLLIENNDLSYEEYQEYRNILSKYNKALTNHPLLKNKFSSCKDVVRELDKVYSKKEQVRMINESEGNQVIEGVKKQ